MCQSPYLAAGMRRFRSLILLCLSAGPPASAPVMSDPIFVEAGAVSGIDFRHENGAEGEKFITETMGSGLLFFDYDGDGDQDLYLVNSAGPAALYRNSGLGRFESAGADAGVEDSGYGMGAVAGDYDSDGDLDLFITCYGLNILYHNEGGGRFRDVAGEVGVGDENGLSTGAAFGDYDNDGDLDLYVAAYVEFGPELNKRCMRNDTLHVYCGPETFLPRPDAFYENDGNGEFREVSASVGIEATAAKELGVVFADLDADGDVDLYVAGDRTSNLLYRNDGGVFTEVSLLAGAAYNDQGKAEAGMGLAAGDYDNDGLTDIFVTNFIWESNTLYRGDGDGFYSDVSSGAGVGAASIPYMGWGTAWLDYDNDGDRDLFVANGHLDDNVALFDRATYAQTNQLFRNDGASGFADVSRQAGSGLALKQVSRGVAVADYDDDGDVDIAINNNNDSAALLRNEGGNSRNWLVVEVRGRAGSAALGARVEVVTGAQTQVAEVTGGGSYLGQSDLRLHFGLGEHTTADQLVVRWLSGATRELTEVAGGQVIAVEEQPDAEGGE